MSNERRMNLSFNLNDPRQKAVYEYLSAYGRAKTATVVDAIMPKTQQWPDAQSIAEKVAVFLSEQNKALLQEVVRICALPPAVQDSGPALTSPHERNCIVEDVSPEEMSDDAFDAMMTFF